MLRKITIGLIAIAAIGLLAMPTEVSARRGGGWHGGGHVGHFHGGFAVRRFGYPYYYYGSYGYSCWRWVETPVGLRRVWVCGDGYPYN
ncbi:MAG TPA: hypothetical protein VMH84_18410 [Xanthobacteraceae bacterium]|nr:hypothetical protein [Xanthobacteraceae bacterium]